MAVGTGVDVVDVGRISRLIDRHAASFLQRWFSPDEIEYCAAKARPELYFAAHLAGKEAVFKALSIRWDGPVPWRSIEINHSERGEPRVRLRGGLLEAATHGGVGPVRLALSHGPRFAMAVAVAERVDGVRESPGCAG